MIVFLGIATGLPALAAPAEYLIALHAASYAGAAIRVRPGRRGLS